MSRTTRSNLTRQSVFFETNKQPYSRVECCMDLFVSKTRCRGTFQEQSTLAKTSSLPRPSWRGGEPSGRPFCKGRRHQPTGNVDRLGVQGLKDYTNESLVHPTLKGF